MMNIFARKASCVALAACVAFSVFTMGCGEKESDASGKKIVRLLDTGIEPVNRKMWEAAIARFEKAHPDAKVDYKVIKDDDYSQGGALIAALRSKNPPDVYFEWTGSSVERDGGNGTSIDLSTYMSPEFEASIDPQSWAGTKYQGKPYLLPMSFEMANVIFYRKKMLADHSISPPKTWEEFLEACKKLKAAGIQPIFHGNQAAWPVGNWASELAVVYLGLERYKQAGEKPPKTLLTDPGFVKAVTRLKELRDIGAFNSDLNTMNDNEGVAHFLAGEGAFIFNGSWMLEQLKEGGDDATYGVLARPKLPDEPEGARYVLANSTGYMINSKTEHKELAFDLLRHLMSPEVQKIRSEGGVNSCLTSAQADITSPLQKQTLEVLHQGGEWVAAPDISWDRFTAERFYEAVKQVLDGEVTPLAALEAAAKDVAARAK